MASVFRRRYRDSSGRLVDCENFTVEFRDHKGGFHRVPGYADRRASEELGRKLERLASLRVVREQPDAALSKWLEGLGGKLRATLARKGFLTGPAASATRPLSRHLDDYKQALRDGAASPRQKGPDRLGMTRAERAMLYRLAVQTGLRSGELRTLTPASFRLDGPEPIVWLPGDHTKNRQPGELPLRRDTVTKLRAFLAGKLPTARVFRLPRPEQVVQIFREGLEAAGIDYRDGSGRVADFHSLRVTFCTLLAASGVPVKTLQALARHSTPVLKLNTYTRPVHGSLAEAVSRLPDFDSEQTDALRATRTDDADAGGRTDRTTGRKPAPNSSIGSVKVRGADWRKDRVERRKTANCCESTRTAAKRETLTPTGFEPVLPA